MKASEVDRLLRALEAPRGHAGRGPETALEIHAARLVAARVADLDAPRLPARARHRAEALFDALPARPLETLARLVFDSWSQLAPAARSLGTERLLRFAGGAAAIDVQVAREPGTDAATLVLAVEGGGEDVEAEVQGAAAPVRLDLDAHGTGSVRLPAAPAEVVLVVRDEDGELVRTPPIAMG